MTSSLGHKQAEITLKTVLVDEKMMPVLDWLNSFPNTFTFASCEGVKEEGIGAYVAWVCRSQEELVNILNKMAPGTYGPETEVRMFQGQLSYRTEWRIDRFEDEMRTFCMLNAIRNGTHVPIDSNT